MEEALNEILDEKLEKAATNIVRSLIRTVINDLANDFIDVGADTKTVLEIVNKRVQMYADGDIKIKKNPAPKAHKAPKTHTSLPAKQGSEVIDAAKNVRSKKWSFFNEEYLYYESEIVNSKGWHWLKDVNTDKIIGAVNDDAQRKLTAQEVKAAINLGFKVSKDTLP